MMDVGAQIATAVISGLVGCVAAGIAAISAMNVHLKWHWTEIQRAHERLDKHDDKKHAGC